MEKFKIEIFKNENPTSKFPEYSSLSEEECRFLQRTIFAKLGVTSPIGGEVLTKKLWDEAKFAECFSSDLGTPEILKFFKKYKLKKSGNVYINWMHFDVVDKMKTVDFIKYFEYIWYPSSDDIDVIDENLNWIMLIDHEGGVRLLNP